MLGFGIALLLLFGGLALWLDRQSTPDPFRTPVKRQVDLSPSTIYAAQFTDTFGKEQELGQWQHHLLIINFWATWCAPCKEEMPLLAKMQNKFRSQGLRIVGIAVDSRENVAKFLENHTTDYPVYPDEVRAIEFSKRLGNRLGLLPFTVAVRPGGEVVFSRLGILKEQDIADIVGEYGLK